MSDRATDQTLAGVLVAFRIVKTADRLDEALVDCFRSRHELGYPPRQQERLDPSIHRGISVYRSLEQAMETGRRLPAIGGFVAKLRLKGEMGITYREWGPRGHLTLWCDALKLYQAVVDIVEIEGSS